MPRALLAVVLAGLWLLAAVPAETAAQSGAAVPGEAIVVAAPSARVRRSASLESGTLAIVYANDALVRLGVTADGWVRVRTPGGVIGWVLLSEATGRPEQAPRAALAPRPKGPADAKPVAVPVAKAPAQAATSPPSPQGGSPGPPDRAAGPGGPAEPPPANVAARRSAAALALDNAVALGRVGQTQAAREKLVALVLGLPDVPERYEAARRLLAYHPVGRLPPLESGRVPGAGQAEAERLIPVLLLREAKTLAREQRVEQAVTLYQALLERSPSDGRAYLGLREALLDSIARAHQAADPHREQEARALYQRYYPDDPLPGTR
jgi:hypothetical protein